MSAIKTDNRPRYSGMKVTREEYLDLEEDGYKYDMIDGVLHMTPSPDFAHGKSANIFNCIIRNFLQKNYLGEAVSEVDVLLPDKGDILRPDISFILSENLHRVKTHIHGAPDLVAEILSDRTAKRDLEEKADRYLTCGVKEYWIIDPRDKTIQVWINRKDHWEKITSQIIESRLLPGLKIDARDVF